MSQAVRLQPAPARPDVAAALELLKPITWFAPMWAFGCGVISAGLPMAAKWPLMLAGVALAGPLVCGTSQAANDWLHGMDVFQEHAIRTTGDATQATGERLADIGGKGLFAKEIHEQLLDRRIDFAVHSLKDLETELPPGIVLACTLPREDPRDVLILGPDLEAAGSEAPYAALPRGAVIGSSSVRRQAQLLHARPDLRIANIRGNVHSRLDKVRRGEFAASLLAFAGLRRLELEHEADVPIDPEIMVPAACQGIVGITVRASDRELRELLAAIADPEANSAAAAERALLGARRLLPHADRRLCPPVAGGAPMPDRARREGRWRVLAEAERDLPAVRRSPCGDGAG